MFTRQKTSVVTCGRSICTNSGTSTFFLSCDLSLTNVGMLSGNWVCGSAIVWSSRKRDESPVVDPRTLCCEVFIDLTFRDTKTLTTSIPNGLRLRTHRIRPFENVGWSVGTFGLLNTPSHPDHLLQAERTSVGNGTMKCSTIFADNLNVLVRKQQVFCLLVLYVYSFCFKFKKRTRKFLNDSVNTSQFPLNIMAEMNFKFILHFVFSIFILVCIKIFHMLRMENYFYNLKLFCVFWYTGVFFGGSLSVISMVICCGPADKASTQLQALKQGFESREQLRKFAAHVRSQKNKGCGVQISQPHLPVMRVFPKLHATSFLWQFL